MSLLTLDDAIAHCRERIDCTECGQEHRQLAEWLEELRKDRELLQNSGKIPKYSVGEKVYLVSTFLSGIRSGIITRIIIHKSGAIYVIWNENTKTEIRRSESRIYKTEAEAMAELCRMKKEEQEWRKQE